MNGSPSNRLLPNKPRGVPRVNDRRVLNGIFWVLRSGAPWRDLPTAFGPYTTCYNRFVRWRRAGVWGRIIEALANAHDAAVQMIDTSIVRVHQHGACITRNQRQSMGRSRGGLTSKIHGSRDADACSKASLPRAQPSEILRVRQALWCSVRKSISDHEACSDSLAGSRQSGPQIQRRALFRRSLRVRPAVRRIDGLHTFSGAWFMEVTGLDQTRRHDHSRSHDQRFDRTWWKKYRQDLESKFRQDEIIVRAHEVTQV
jgi:transposase